MSGAELLGKTVVVSGASSGIGAAMAKRLAQAGAIVFLVARSEGACGNVAQAIRRGGGQAGVFPADLADPAQVADVVARIQRAAGPPDVIVNNAGAGRFLAIEETSAEELQQMIAVPYLGAFNLTRGFMPGMLLRNSGYILNVTSPAAFSSFPGSVAYSAARWAMRGLSNALAADLYRTEIQVGLLVAGQVDSPYFDNNPGSAARLPRITRFLPTLQPEDVAEAALRCVRQRKRQLVVPRAVGVLVWLYRFFPHTIDQVMWRSGWRRP